jgi:GH18 family chitinase
MHRAGIRVAILGALITSAPAFAGGKLIGYFTQWGIYGRNYQVKDLVTRGAAAKLTHLNYAFGNVVNGECGIFAPPQGDAWADYQKGYPAEASVDGVADKWDDPLKGNFGQLKKLKALQPGLKVMISLGGWTWSGGFSAAAATAQSREKLVRSCIDLYIRGNLPGVPAGAAAGLFDGIDVDWEYPAATGLQAGIPADAENFALLLEEFRRQLNAVKPGLLLTIASGAGPDKLAPLDLARIVRTLDHVNIMTYDFHGGWEATTNFHSPLFNQKGNPASAKRYSSAEAVKLFLDAGVPSSKVVLGIGFYGRGWRGVQPGPAGDGLYQSGQGPAQGTWDDWSSGPTGVLDYHHIARLEATGVKRRHPESKVPYLYEAGTGTWVSYDDPTSIAEKMGYVRQQGLGGAMFWEVSGDDASGSLVKAIHAGLGGAVPASGVLLGNPVGGPKVDPVGPSMTSGSTPPISAVQGAPSATLFAPYFYTWGHSNAVYPVQTLREVQDKAGVQAVHLAFGLADPFGAMLGGSNCKLTNDGFVNFVETSMAADVAAFKARGGRVVMSFGGANGLNVESDQACATDDALFHLLDGFVARTGITELDFDAEQPDILAAPINQKRARVLARLQRVRPEVKISFTLASTPADRWAAGGLNASSLDAVRAAINAGVKLTTVNLMVMDFGGYYSSGKAMGDLAISALEGTHAQLRTLLPARTDAELWQMLGATPMIGQNDVPSEQFTLEDARKLAAFARSRKLGLLSFWAIQRDQPCPAGGGLAICSNVNSSPFEFSAVFNALH